MKAEEWRKIITILKKKSKLGEGQHKEDGEIMLKLKRNSVLWILILIK